MSETGKQYSPYRLQARYLTAHFGNLPVIFVILLLNAALAGCVGYTPPVLPETSTLPALTTTRPPQTPRATRTLPPPTPLPSPALTQGLKTQDVHGETIRFWYAPGARELSSLAGEFNRSNPWGITVETESFEDDTELVEKIQASLYGKLPDLAAIYPFQAVHLNSSGGLIVDLGPYIVDRDWGFSGEEIRDFLPSFWGQDVYEEKRLGIPFYRQVQALYYNETWAKELGYNTPPATPQEFKVQVCAASRAKGGELEGGARLGGWLVDTDTATMAGWIYAFGGEIDAPSGKGYEFNTPQTRQAFTFLRELVDAGCAWSGPNHAPSSEFTGRKALAIAGSITGLSSQAAEFSSASSKDQWTVLPFPSPQGKPAIDSYGPSLSILRSTPRKQLAAWLFLKWLASTESQASLVRSYGILPVRASALDRLGEYRKDHPQWAAALDLLSYARLEPGYASWKTVRLVLSDAGVQLFSPTFKTGEIPELIKTLDSTAAEIHGQSK